MGTIYLHNKLSLMEHCLVFEINQKSSMPSASENQSRWVPEETNSLVDSFCRLLRIFRQFKVLSIRRQEYSVSVDYWNNSVEMNADKQVFYRPHHLITARCKMQRGAFEGQMRVISLFFVICAGSFLKNNYNNFCSDCV